MNTTTDLLDVSLDCGHGCKTVLAAVDQIATQVCDSKETTAQIVIVFTILIIAQLVAFTCVCMYMLRHGYYAHFRRYTKKDEAKKLVDDQPSQRVVAEIDDAEL